MLGGAILLLAAVAWTAPAHSETTVPERPASLLDAANDRVLDRAYVPSAADKVGEVRLIRRGEADVVQTLLYSKILARVVAEIRKKELANWPPGAPGHEDALRYVALLDRVQQEIWNRVPRDAIGADRRQKMGIEFVLTRNTALIRVGALAIVEEEGEVRVASIEPIESFEPSRDYAQRNMRLIAADSFHVEGPALDSLLAPFAWLEMGEAP